MCNFKTVKFPGILYPQWRHQLYMLKQLQAYIVILWLMTRCFVKQYDDQEFFEMCKCQQLKLKSNWQTEFFCLHSMYLEIVIASKMTIFTFMTTLLGDSWNKVLGEFACACEIFVRLSAQLLLCLHIIPDWLNVKNGALSRTHHLF